MVRQVDQHSHHTSANYNRAPEPVSSIIENFYGFAGPGSLIHLERLILFGHVKLNHNKGLSKLCQLIPPETPRIFHDT